MMLDVDAADPNSSPVLVAGTIIDDLDALSATLPPTSDFNYETAENGVHLHFLRIPQRSRGCGKAFLVGVLEAADRHHATLTLEADPSLAPDDPGLIDLVGFYQRLGFEVTGMTGDCYVQMRRHPGRDGDVPIPKAYEARRGTEMTTRELETMIEEYERRIRARPMKAMGFVP